MKSKKKSNGDIPRCSKCGNEMPKLLGTVVANVGRTCNNCELAKPAAIRLAVDVFGGNGHYTSYARNFVDYVGKGATRDPKMAIQLTRR